MLSAMSSVLVEFSDGTMFVYQAESVVCSNGSKPAVDDDCVVDWRNKNGGLSKHAAKVMRYGDEDELGEIMSLVTSGKLKPKDVAGYNTKSKGRGCRLKRTKPLSDVESDEEESAAAVQAKKSKPTTKNEKNKNMPKSKCEELLKKIRERRLNEKIRKIQNANDWMRKLIDKQLAKTCAKTDRAILIADQTAIGESSRPVGDDVNENSSDRAGYGSINPKKSDHSNVLTTGTEDLAAENVSLRKENESLKQQCDNLKAAIAALNLLPEVLDRLKNFNRSLCTTSTPKPANASTLCTTNTPKPSNASRTGQTPLPVAKAIEFTPVRSALSSISNRSSADSPALTVASATDIVACGEEVEINFTSGDKWKNAVARANRKDYCSYTNDIMHGLFTLECMACHTLFGGNKDKEALPADAVTAITEEVRRTFPSAALSDIHQTMRQKLSNAVKSIKRSSSKAKSTTNNENE